MSPVCFIGFFSNPSSFICYLLRLIVPPELNDKWEHEGKGGFDLTEYDQNSDERRSCVFKWPSLFSVVQLV